MRTLILIVSLLVSAHLAFVAPAVFANPSLSLKSRHMLMSGKVFKYGLRIWGGVNVARPDYEKYLQENLKEMLTEVNSSEDTRREAIELVASHHGERKLAEFYLMLADLNLGNLIDSVKN